MWLQSVFMFPNSSTGREISVEVVAKNVDDCSSISWTWFVESRCIPGSFIECQNRVAASGVYMYGIYSNCILTCVCKPTCDYLYLKYTHVPGQNHSEQQLCEIKLLYGNVEPEDSGLLPRADVQELVPMIPVLSTIGWVNYPQIGRCKETRKLDRDVIYWN